MFCVTEERFQVISGVKLVARVAELLDLADWSVEVEKALDGMRIDVYATYGAGPPVVIECKAFTRLVGLRTIRELASRIGFLRESEPLLESWLVTTSGFTHNAMEALHRYRIEGLTFTELARRLKATKQKPTRTISQWAANIADAQKLQKRIFVVMPFTDEMLDVFILGIRWVASQLDMVAERADDLEHNGEIIDEVRQAIKTCNVVVADTSGGNPNVCYEVGYAHALEKPTILICRKGEELPFDLQGTNHLIYPNIVSLREPFTKKLKATIISSDG